MSSDEEPQKIGYKNPPIHTRFPKGVSGNPGGRQKGHKGLKTDLEAALNARTTLENHFTGELEKGRNQEHAIRRLVGRAALGDIKAQALLFPMILQVLGAEDRHTGPRKLSALDQEILTEVLGSRLLEAMEQSAAAPADEADQSDVDPENPNNEDSDDGDANHEDG